MQNMDRNQQNEDKLNEKEYYRSEIIKIINSINKRDMLEYFYLFISGKVKGVNIDETKKV